MTLYRMLVNHSSMNKRKAETGGKKNILKDAKNGDNESMWLCCRRAESRWIDFSASLSDRFIPFFFFILIQYLFWKHVIDYIFCKLS